VTDDTTKGVTLTHSQSVTRLAELGAELERLGTIAQEDITPEQEAEFAELRETFKKVDLHRKQLERSAELAEIRSLASGVNGGQAFGGATSSRSDFDRDAILEPDSVEDRRFKDPWNLRDVQTFGRSKEETGQELRSRALAAIEKMPASSDNIRAAATDILENKVDNPHKLARQILLTSSPAYVRAWSKMANNSPHLLTSDESRALDEVRCRSSSTRPSSSRRTVRATTSARLLARSCVPRTSGTASLPVLLLGRGTLKALRFRTTPRRSLSRP
jgi:hypothetical protein